ncbi:MAG TPA: DUF4234 domain-containing protein [Candidatus Saccharimonadales bacterium]|nr:DUF4234 domain-containing protein [Candidatus Saccharimonadales bacterium]
MKNRNPLAVFFLPIITLGIYGIVWFVKTKNEMNAKGANIPTAWLIIVPFVSIWWLWKYSQGVDTVTQGEYSAAVSLLLLWFLGSIGMAIIQSGFNKVNGAAAPVAPTMPQAPTGPMGPAEPPVGPTPPTPTPPTQTPPAPTPPTPPVAPTPPTPPAPPVVGG